MQPVRVSYRIICLLVDESILYDRERFVGESQYRLPR